MSDGFDPASLVREVRARAGLSQRALAERAGTSQSVVARIELGETNPTTATLNRLLGAAGQEVVVRIRRRSPAEDRDPDSLARRITAFFAEGLIPGVASVYLFGSTARRGGHRDSDVDVAALLDRSEYPSEADRGELRVRLSAGLVGALEVNDVDLVILNDLPPGFARRIVLDGVRLVCPRPELDHTFRRDVQLRWADLAPFLRRTSAVKLEALGP